ncbi:MAG: hypothetical protein AAGG07_10170 [Planctomycetota bacterium]
MQTCGIHHDPYAGWQPFSREWHGATPGACAPADTADGRSREADRLERGPRWDEIAEAARERAREAWEVARDRQESSRECDRQDREFAIPMPPVDRRDGRVQHRVEQVYRVTTPLVRGVVLDIFM